MDLISLYYFSELAKTLHITKTAERLYITQQTLSNHIARLEEYFDIPLFYRSPSLSLTPAGEQVLAFAKSVNREHTNLMDILSDMKEQESGVLRVGGSTVRVHNFMPHILPQFTARYPKVDVQFFSSMKAKDGPDQLEENLDYALVVYDDRNPNIIARHLANDQIYLCVPDRLLQKYYGTESDALKCRSEHGANIADFAKLPFCISFNHIGHKVSACFQEAQVTPWAYITSDQTQLSIAACFEGLVAAFVTHIFLLDQQEQIPDDINIFPLLYKGEPLVQNVSLIRRKDRYLPHYGKYFLELLFRYYSEIEHIHMDRIV